MKYSGPPLQYPLMLAPVAKFVGGKLLTAVLTVTVVLIVVWYWRMDPAQRSAVWATVWAALLWTALAAVLPWALFFVPPLVLKAESNAASAAMLAGYLVVDAAAALWLAGWQIGGTLAWGVVLLGLASAAVYNFLVCDYLAERAEDAA